MKMLAVRSGRIFFHFMTKEQKKVDFATTSQQELSLPSPT